jgi:hypothetical protein
MRQSAAGYFIHTTVQDAEQIIAWLIQENPIISK